MDMESSALKTVDWLIVAVYMVFVVWLGIRFSRNQKTSRGFFLGRGRIPGWAVGLSMFATIISSWAFLALPGKAFRSDIQYLMAVSGIPIVTWIACRWVVPMYRRKVRLSAYEYLEQRFGPGARIYGNLAFLVVHFGKMAAILYLLCLAISAMTGWSIFALIALIGLATLLYTFVGGIEGVIWTDVTQGILLLLGGVLSVGFILLKAPGGAAAVIETASQAGKFTLVEGTFDWERMGVVVLVCFGLNFYLQKYVSDQTVVQRFLVARTDRQATRALWTSSLVIMAVWILFMGLGALLWSYYELRPELLPEVVRSQPDRVFPHFIGHELPAGVSGLVLSGLVAATMSTLSSDLNSLSAVVIDDYYCKLRPDQSEEDLLVVSRRVVAAAGVFGILLAMGMTRIHSMADAALSFVSLVGGGVLGMYMLGLLVPRCRAGALYMGIAAGLAVVCWGYFCGPGKPGLAGLPAFPLHALWIGLTANLVVFSIGLAISLVRPGPPQPLNSAQQDE